MAKSRLQIRLPVVLVAALEKRNPVPEKNPRARSFFPYVTSYGTGVIDIARIERSRQIGRASRGPRRNSLRSSLISV